MRTFKNWHFKFKRKKKFLEILFRQFILIDQPLLRSTMYTLSPLGIPKRYASGCLLHSSPLILKGLRRFPPLAYTFLTCQTPQYWFSKCGLWTDSINIAWNWLEIGCCISNQLDERPLPDFMKQNHRSRTQKSVLTCSANDFVHSTVLSH